VLDLVHDRESRRTTTGLAAIGGPVGLTDAYPLVRDLVGLSGTRRWALAVREREFGRRGAPEGKFREVEIDVLPPEWHREGARVAATIVEVGQLLDAAMELVRGRPIVFGTGTLRLPR